MAKKSRPVDKRKQLIRDGLTAGLSRPEAVAQADKILGEQDRAEIVDGQTRPGKPGPSL